MHKEVINKYFNRHKMAFNSLYATKDTMKKNKESKGRKKSIVLYETYLFYD
jgi:hypothetical protein